MGTQLTPVFRLYNRVLKRYSNLVFRSILRTKPIPVNPDSRAVLYTLLERRNVRAYLLTAKSFLRFYSDVRVVVQDDGTLTPRCCRELRAHLPGIEIYSRAEADQLIRENAGAELLRVLPDLDRCVLLLPLKLLNVIYRFHGSDIIIFDSDMIFMNEPKFIIDWIKGGRACCFHSDGGSLLAAVFHAIGFGFPKVNVSDFNSGLIGFHNDVSESLLVEICQRIRAHDEALFGNWEIEQAIWSVIFNSFENPINLDRVAKDYVGSGYWEYSRLVNSSVVAHFVGSIRFKNLRYVRLANKVCRELKVGLPESCREIG